MSMSEYENQNHKEGDNFFPSTIEPGLPDDFSEEDIVFAQELSTLFSAPDEILPPYYAQTLLQAEDQRYTVVDKAFAQKTSARVFRALKLRRRLYSQRRSLFSAIGDTLREITLRKSLVAWAAAFMLIMMLTVAFTAPSFEQGVSMLLRNSQSGVVQVKLLPPANHIRQHDFAFDQSYLGKSYDTNPKQVPLIAVGHMLNFNIYWPQWKPANYILDSIKIYEDTSNVWANGSYVDLVYDVDTSHTALKGTGQIVIREFMPVVQVLQVVQDGNAYAIDPDQYGDNPRAIYVDGQWQMPAGIWKPGGRSEVIYQQGGVVFWIAGDQRDGINQKVLWKLAQSLVTVPYSPHVLQKSVMATILLHSSSNMVDDPFATDIIHTASADGTGGQYYMPYSAYLQGKLGTSKAIGHGH